MRVDRKAFVKFFAGVFVLYLCVYYWPSASRLLALLAGALKPVIIGLAAAYIINILMSFYERHYFAKRADTPAVSKTRRPVCMAAAFVTLIGILTLLISLVIPELVSCCKLLIAEIPPVIERLLENEYISKVLPENIIKSLSSVKWQEYISKIIQVLTRGISDATGTIFSAVSSVFSSITVGFISIIFAVYLLFGKEKLQRQSKRVLAHYLPQKWFGRVLYLAEILNDCFHRYIVGQCTEAIILGALCMAGMLIFRLPYAVMIGTMIGFTALIPVAGAYIGAAFGAVLIVTVSPLKALFFLIFIVVLQQIEGNLIYPKVVGKSIGLPAIFVLAAITVGGGLFGISGMLLGVPIASALYRLLHDELEQTAPQEENCIPIENDDENS